MPASDLVGVSGPTSNLPAGVPAVRFERELVPAALRERAQWVCWRYITRGGKKTKCPVIPKTGRRASSINPSTWASFDEAIAAWWRHNVYAGVGFVFTADDPFTGIDLDECLDDRGALVDGARQIVDSLNSYTEVSPSGRGVKVFISGEKPAGSRSRSRAIPGFKEVEIYSEKRFFAVTACHLPGTPRDITERQQELEQLCKRLWPKRRRMAAGSAAAGGFDGADDALVEKAGAARNGQKFRSLFAGDTSMHGGDDSAADLALCSQLAFWTGRDPARMDRIFRRSGLYRQKWDEHRGNRTYGNITIDAAIAACQEVYRPPGRVRAPSNDQVAAVSGSAAQLVPLGGRDPNTGRLVLSPQRTLPTAEAYVSEFHHHSEGRTLHSYAGLHLEWRGNRYCEVEDDSLRHRLQPWLHAALRYVVVDRRTGQMELRDFESNPTTINRALDSIRTYTHQPATITVPSWLGDEPNRPPALEILLCRTLNLHIPTGRTFAPTPALFATNALDFDPDPNAAVPERWLGFLGELLEEDVDAWDLLQEWFGYCLTPDTTQQKMLIIVGPKRSGKGTIARILTRLVGPANVCGPTVGSLASNFGLQPLIGKSLAVVSDARFRGGNVAAVVERMLCISGEDAITVDRKFLTSVTMKLPTRFMFLANELPRLSDASGALAGRFLMVRLTESFYGREDTELTEKLVAELPGILNWAIEGWQQLRKRGRFVQPASVEHAIRDLEDLFSPVGAFVREECIVGPGHRVAVDDLYAAWKTWCERDGRKVASTKQTFGRDLAAAVPGVVRRRGTGMVPFYDGIGQRWSR